MSKAQEKGGTVRGGGFSRRNLSGAGNSGWKGQEGSDIPGTLKTGDRPRYAPYDGTLCGEKPSKQGDAKTQMGSLRKSEGARYSANETSGVKNK